MREYITGKPWIDPDRFENFVRDNQQQYPGAWMRYIIHPVPADGEMLEVCCVPGRDPTPRENIGWHQLPTGPMTELGRGKFIHKLQRDAVGRLDELLRVYPDSFFEKYGVRKPKGWTGPMKTNPISTTTKILLGVGAFVGVAAGAGAYEHYKNKSASGAITLSISGKQTWSWSPPSGGTLATQTANNSNIFTSLGTASGATITVSPSGVGTSQLVLTWTDASGNSQTTTVNFDIVA